MVFNKFRIKFRTFWFTILQVWLWKKYSDYQYNFSDAQHSEITFAHHFCNSQNKRDSLKIHQKKKLLPFSFANYPKKLLSNFQKIKLNKRGVYFLGECRCLFTWAKTKCWSVTIWVNSISNRPTILWNKKVLTPICTWKIQNDEFSKYPWSDINTQWSALIEGVLNRL